MLARSVPKVSGEIEVLGLHEQSTLSRSDSGVVFIQSNTDLDAYFTLGFAHGQDRLWQMEVSRRRGAGRLSEILGKSALNSDKYFRTLGVYRNARKIWQQLEKPERQVLQAYVAGVNAAIESYDILPPEFLILDHEPEPWLPEDSLAWIMLLAVDLSSNMGAEIQRMLLSSQVGGLKTNQIMPAVTFEGKSGDSILAGVPESVAQVFWQDSVRPFVEPKSFIGSNSWVLSGMHTQTGLPMLANDPHLTNSLPSIWYLASLRGKNLDVMGATIPGFPFVMIGKNKNIAWGMTNMMADTQDLYLEKINLLNRNQYQVDGRYLDMEVWEESIQVKSDFLQDPEPAIKHQVRRTHRGPVISDLGKKLDDYVYSLQWTADLESGGSFRSFHQLAYVTNWQEFNDAMESFVGPIHNFVYADIEGNIGYLAPGVFPVRGNREGALPSPGWSSKNDWQEYIAFSDIPRVFNPESGLIVTANNKVVADNYPYYVTHDWAPPYRADRIRTEIEKKIAHGGKISLSDMARIQGDIQSPAVYSVLPLLKQVSLDEPELIQAHALIKDWNGVMDRNSGAALLYVSWMSHFNRLLLQDDISASAPLVVVNNLNGVVFNFNLTFIEKVLLQDLQSWCDYQATEHVETCAELLQISFSHAVNEISHMSGSDPDSWAWGELHQTAYPHFPFNGKEQALDVLFSRYIESGGSGNTINVAPAELKGEDKFFQYFGAGYRQLISLGHNDEDRFIISTGQSGNLFSRHYDDLISKHRDMEYLNMKGPIKHKLYLNVADSNEGGQP
ncbi:penicillin acylase family protein [Pseudoalteromonas piscicida]|uniref:penicillin acylase family protein n=1 Tax=Pseudoalteromonas piscicida TaxID=43662 RepID=UPI0030A87276